MGQHSDVTERALSELASVSASGDTVISLYLNLDPSEFATPPARATEIDSLLDGAAREIEGQQRPHEELMALRGAHERAAEILRSDGDAYKGARGLAVFAGEPLQSERVLRLAHPVRSAVVISNAPFIAPLAEQASRQRVCVALIDERFARILRGSADGLREAISFGDEVHGRHDQGGWSQARYQRSIEEDIDGHLRHTARILFDMLRVAPYDMLLIACTEPLWPRAVEHLHADVRATLREQRLSLDVPDATLPDVEAAVQPVLAEERREHEDALLAELREHRARVRDARSAAGLAEVLDSLVQRRVQALLYDAGLHAGGVVCQRCGWMGVDGDRCPMDGAPLERLDDVVESAVESAVGQSAEVLALHDRPDLGPLGGIAATLRY